MKKLPPSERMRKELRQYVAQGTMAKESLISGLAQRATQMIVQELFEAEAKEFVGRGYYERGQEEEVVHRNGYEPYRIKTGEGKITVYKPQVRNSEEPFKSRLGAFLKGNSDVLEKLAVEMYARGMSTRDIEDALQEATGERVLSKSAASRVSEKLYEDFEAYQNRDLSEYEVEYMFADAVYESIRKRFKVKEAVLCVWGICRDQRKVLLHMAIGNKESEACWVELFRDMVRRGLREPTTISSDGAPGVIKAIESVFGKSLRVRCWFHRMQNLAGKVPMDAWPEIKAQLRAIRDAANLAQGKQLAAQFILEHQRDYPSLIKAFKVDLEALLNVLRVPVAHRKYVRTTNIIERSFGEERRRTKVIPGFLTEKSALKLIFSVLIRATKRWQGVHFDALTIARLDKLRNELGLRTRQVEEVS
jgi:transposase-like protein